SNTAVPRSAQWSHAVSTSSPPSTPSVPDPQAVRTEWPVREQHDHRPQTSPNDHELVRQLQQAVTCHQVHAAISSLRKNIPPVPEKKRWSLISHPGILDRIARALDPWESSNAYAGLLEFTFGDPAKALHQQEHFNWVIDYLKKSDPNRFLFFDC